MNETNYEDYEHLIEKLVRSFMRYDIEHHVNNNFEDMKQEACIAAWQALSSYSADKNVKASTYLALCVKRRLLDCRKVGDRKVRIGYTDELPEVGMVDENIAKFELEDTMTKVLDEKEMLVAQKIYLEGYSRRDLTSGPCRIVSQREGKKCYLQATSKLRSYAENQMGISMKELPAKRLKDSLREKPKKLLAAISSENQSQNNVRVVNFSSVTR